MVVHSNLKELCTQKGGFSLQKNDCDAFLWSINEVEFDQSILIWHIATTLCYYSDVGNQDGSDIDKCHMESKHIATYLTDISSCDKHCYVANRYWHDQVSRHLC